MAKEHIMAVEDEEDILELLTYNLAREGYRVSGLTSGEECVQLARSSLPDLILLDLMLPGMDGLEVCRQLKQTHHDPAGADHHAHRQGGGGRRGHRVGVGRR